MPCSCCINSTRCLYAVCICVCVYRYAHIINGIAFYYTAGWVLFLSLFDRIASGTKTHCNTPVSTTTKNYMRWAYTRSCSVFNTIIWKFSIQFVCAVYWNHINARKHQTKGTTISISIIVSFEFQSQIISHPHLFHRIEY